MFRQLHRWASLPLIVFLMLVLVTGVYLQIEEVAGLVGEEGEPALAAADAAASAPLTSEQIAVQLDTALAKARAAEPDFVPKRIELTVEPGRQATRLAVQPRGGPFVEVDHASGQVKAEMNPEMPLHVIFIRLHTGAMLGPFGIVIVFLSSLVLLFLAVSGGVLYWQMWRNRAGRGRGAVFWK
jgi:uncharacterized iron-regulated membrane protein